MPAAKPKPTAPPEVIWLCDRLAQRAWISERQCAANHKRRKSDSAYDVCNGCAGVAALNRELGREPRNVNAAQYVHPSTIEDSARRYRRIAPSLVDITRLAAARVEAREGKEEDTMPRRAKGSAAPKAAPEAASVNPVQGFTIAELAQRLGVGSVAIRNRLDKAQIRPVGRTNVGPTRVPASVYDREQIEAWIAQGTPCKSTRGPAPARVPKIAPAPAQPPLANVTLQSVIDQVKAQREAARTEAEQAERALHEAQQRFTSLSHALEALEKVATA